MSGPEASAGARKSGRDDGDAGGPGIPRWVRVSVLVAALLLVLMLVLMAVLGGEHGPGRHSSSALPDAPALLAGWLG